MHTGTHDRLPVVFIGPTLSPDDVRFVLPAACLPPASQGDIVRAVLAHQPSAILLIDGTFQNAPAVRHKEILWALAEGVPVIGAASMGALRAAELHRFGMIGIGLVYRWYRRFALLPDDAVAVLHAPEELSHVALTTALVDIRVTLRAAERAGIVNRALRLRLLQAAKGLNFRSRSLEATIEAACGEYSAARRQVLLQSLEACVTSQKRADGLKALQWLRDRPQPLTVPPCARKNFVFTNAFRLDLLHAGIKLT